MSARAPKVKIRATKRGFDRGEFFDQMGEACSIQESSLATDSCIWLGINEVVPQVFVPGDGWKPVELPTHGEVLKSGRMHLTQKQVAALLPLLQKFVETGRLR